MHRRLVDNPVLAVGLELLLPSLVLLHLFVAPYTKVEESFNIQATHDLIRYGVPFGPQKDQAFELFDHTHFRGAVPRTFSGALILAGLSQPFLGLAQRLQLNPQTLGMSEGIVAICQPMRTTITEGLR